MDTDAVVVGAGLAGLVAAQELMCRGRKVALVDQENEANLGGQRFAASTPHQDSLDKAARLRAQ